MNASACAWKPATPYSTTTFLAAMLGTPASLRGTASCVGLSEPCISSAKAAGAAPAGSRSRSVCITQCSFVTVASARPPCPPSAGAPRSKPFSGPGKRKRRHRSVIASSVRLRARALQAQTAAAVTHPPATTCGRSPCSHRPETGAPALQAPAYRCWRGLARCPPASGGSPEADPARAAPPRLQQARAATSRQRQTRVTPLAPASGRPAHDPPPTERVAPCRPSTSGRSA